MSDCFSISPITIAVIASLIAASVALSHLIWFIFFQYKDAERWKILNNPNVIIDEIYVVAWKKINNDEIDKGNWGYDIRTSAIIEHKIYTGEYRLLESLLLWDEENNKEQSNQRFLILSQLENYVKQKKLNSKDYSVKKDMSFKIKLKNIGFTTALNLDIEIEFYNPTANGWEILNTQKSNTGIPQHSDRFISSNIFTPIKLTLPDPTKFLAKLKYETVKGEIIKSDKIPFNYHPKYDSWTIGE